MPLYKKSARTSSPVDDLRRHPILNLHWGNLQPAETVADLRFRRQVERVHGLGPRVIAELLAEIGVERSIMPTIHEKLARYASIDPEALQALGADKFPPAPLHEVRRTS